MLWAAAGTLCYSLFSLVEGVGMIFRAGWACWLAIGESGFFIPIEVYELSRPVKFSWWLLLVLVVNVIIVWYLFQNRNRIFRHHHHHHGGGAAGKARQVEGPCAGKWNRSQRTPRQPRL